MSTLNTSKEYRNFSYNADSIDKIIKSLIKDIALKYSKYGLNDLRTQSWIKRDLIEKSSKLQSILRKNDITFYIKHYSEDSKELYVEIYNKTPVELYKQKTFKYQFFITKNYSLENLLEINNEQKN